MIMMDVAAVLLMGDDSDDDDGDDDDDSGKLISVTFLAGTDRSYSSYVKF